jgi:drug/metabolite transporter (DMT)-like permease
MGKSAQKNGMAITSVAVKMSMAVSVLGMVFIYNEQLPFLKIIAILLAFSGVILVSFSKKSSDSKQQTWWMLLILFFGSGILDLLLNYVQKTQVEVISTALFSAFGFGIAGLIGLGILIAQIIRQKTRIEFRNVIGGVILGVPNFFSIFLLMRAYNSVTWSDSSVLAVINVAVVCISTLFGTLIFSEKISWAKGLGLCCSLLAIYLFYLVN